MTRIHCYSKSQNSFTARQTLGSGYSLRPSPRQQSLSFIVAMVLPFPECHTAAITQSVAFRIGVFHY